MVISTPNAPQAIGPYVQARVCNNLLFISGCCPFSAKDGSIIGGTIEDQTFQVMTNLKEIVLAAKKDMKDVVKTTCFLSNMNNFTKFNEVYASFFSDGLFPARSCVEVARLPKDILIEVEAIVSLE